jgi:ferredoxin-thioredoxin reductase catalytic chain
MGDESRRRIRIVRPFPPPLGENVMSSSSTQSVHSFPAFMGALVQVSLGLSFMLIGGLLIITFWLLPIGLLLALLGLATMFAGGSSSKPSFHSTTQAKPKPSSASVNSVRRFLNFLSRFESKTGTILNPDPDVRNRVMLGLAKNYDRSGRPLCPCVHHPDKEIDLSNREPHICPCHEMRDCKFCHCLLFVSPNGLPITQYLAENHEGRQLYGLVEDPAA